MSKYYDDDDMYDYDDDYDNRYDESHDQGNYENYSNESTAVIKTTTYHDPANPPSDYVQFVMELLGTVVVTAAGTRVVGITSEARVLQMLEAFSFDLDATITYFMKQRETSKVVVPKKVESNTSSKSAVIKAAEKKISLKPKETKIVPTKKMTLASEDLNAMGFEADTAMINEKRSSQLKAMTPISTIANTTTNATLITSSALLSDDEYDSYNPKMGKKADDTQRKGSSNLQSETVPHITMVVAGHVDAGKSTLVGNLLFKAGNVAQRTMHKYEKESQLTGKGSFALAWVLDESQSEREHGVTIDIAEKQLKTAKRSFTILDAPGHRDFIPNMISGATQADVALLVIPASKGEYETSMSDGAQTREHAVLLKALGVKQIIVVINKMDNLAIPWSHNRFLRIKNEVQNLLEELQFSPKSIRFVPLSGLTGENLVTLSPTCVLNQWYNGPTLLQAIDDFKQPMRHTDGPLRAVITSVITENDKGCDVQVSVLQGKLSVGRGVGLASTAGAATVKKILNPFAESVNTIFAGEKGIISLIDRSNRTGEEMCLREGMILSKGPPLPGKCLKFKATLLTMFGLQPPIIPGCTYELYLHGEVVQCCITKLYSMNNQNGTDSKGGSGLKEKENRKTSGGLNKKDRQENPKCIPGGRCAKVKIEVQQSICIEPFKISDALGRFALRTKGKTCAVGICEKVKKDCG